MRHPFWTTLGSVPKVDREPRNPDSLSLVVHCPAPRQRPKQGPKGQLDFADVSRHPADLWSLVLIWSVPSIGRKARMNFIFSWGR